MKNRKIPSAIRILLSGLLLGLPLASMARADSGFLQFDLPPWTLADNGASGTEIDKVAAAVSSPSGQRSKTGEVADGDGFASPPPLKPQDYKQALKDIGITMAQTIPSSPLETIYSNRAGQPLHQFGYDILDTDTPGRDNKSGAVSPVLPSGAVQDSFILNIGDKLTVTFRGQRNTRGDYAVGSDGNLVIDDLDPVMAAGKSIGAIRAELEKRISDLPNTDIFVSLESVKQVSVIVAGQVKNPGRKTLTVFDSALDALEAAGGVQKSGSLRRIQLIHADGQTQTVDLYSILTANPEQVNLALREGDRIVVPTIGPTLAVAGQVNRPGIYETDGKPLSVRAALTLAGGLLNPGENRIMRLSPTTDGRDKASPVKAESPEVLANGAVLVVARAEEARGDTVTLDGETRQPGLHTLGQSHSLKALLKDPQVLGPNIYPLIGVVERNDKKTLTRQMIDFPPDLVVHGKFDKTLQDGDKVTLFSRARMLALQRADRDSADDSGADRPDDPAMLSFLKERSVFVRGFVRDPGAWPVSSGATLESVLAAAGGMKLDADSSAIEITPNARAGGGNAPERKNIDLARTDPATVPVHPGDAIRVNQESVETQGQSVLIAGAVVHPGHYDLLPGDTLGKLIARAGGLTAQAYPPGAIFSREADRKAEEARFRAAARELERAVAAAAEKKDNPPDAEKIAMAKDLAHELQDVQGVGRITVQADPAILNAHPEQDMLLAADDRVYIPQRSLTVRVYGEVLSPANLQFRQDKSAHDYIDEAGGLTYYADEDRAFVLLPDGSAQPLHVSLWNHKPDMIPPGSTIVVPRDPKPFDFVESAKDITQILSNLAVTSVFINDIRRN